MFRGVPEKPSTIPLIKIDLYSDLIAINGLSSRLIHGRPANSLAHMKDPMSG